MTNETSRHAYRQRLDPRTPVPWVIVVDAMSQEQAVEAGRALGGIGVTGRFMSGSFADALKRYSDWKARHPEAAADGGGGD